MERGPQGRYEVSRISAEPFRAFIPHGLPPDPPLALDAALQDALEQANRALGRLDGIGLLLPDLPLFLYFYVRKEAVLSSQIEGTQSSLSDLLLYESAQAPGVPLDDVQEVSNYVAALQRGMERVRANAPLTGRLIREIHGVLMAKGRGSNQQPGEFRRSQNWVGGSRPGNALFVPPPSGEVLACMAELDRFLHDTEVRTPTLVKAALTHVQFETIHPFLDGNGRVGRLLIPLLLCYEGALQEPLLYLSLYLKAHRAEYYDLLQRVRLQGDWEGWLAFFLEGVRQTADQAAEAARRILRLFEEDRRKLERLGRGAGSALRVHHLMQRKPLLAIPTAVRDLALTRPTVAAALEAMRQATIVRETSGKPRNRLFVYDAYLRILEEGTEP
ncbi:MAG: Fic family protein [Chthonomonadales bacterium]|nr:Fic family protein [Chthonomonadales bacterium]